jgi:hypothetical protein
VHYKVDEQFASRRSIENEVTAKWPSNAMQGLAHLTKPTANAKA